MQQNALFLVDCKTRQQKLVVAIRIVTAENRNATSGKPPHVIVIWRSVFRGYLIARKIISDGHRKRLSLVCVHFQDEWRLGKSESTYGKL